MIKQDCFAYIENGKLCKEECNVLKKLYCKNEKCKFYKTMEQYLKDGGKK